MDKFREKITSRGTVDCPFQRYAMKSSRPGAIFTNIHWHPEAEILYMKQGAVEVRADKNIFSLSEGQIAFIPPGQLHAIQGVVANSSYEAFVYSLDLLTLPDTHFFQKELIAPLRAGLLRFPYVLTPADTPYPTVSSALDRICQTNKDEPNYKQMVFFSMVQLYISMMDHLIDVYPDSMHKRNETIKNCLQYMQQHYAEHLTLNQIAAHVHLHPNYLCALFKDYTGQTVFQHLIRIRIENAAELLRTKDISVGDVSGICGFESTGFFTKKFKAIIGKNPKEYALRYKKSAGP